jgi:hypothetical protein
MGPALGWNSRHWPWWFWLMVSYGICSANLKLWWDGVQWISCGPIDPGRSDRTRLHCCLDLCPLLFFRDAFEHGHNSTSGEHLHETVDSILGPQKFTTKYTPKTMVSCWTSLHHQPNEQNGGIASGGSVWSGGKLRYFMVVLDFHVPDSRKAYGRLV